MEDKIFKILYPAFFEYVAENEYLFSFINSSNRLYSLIKLQSEFLSEIFLLNEKDIEKKALELAKKHHFLKINFLFIYEALEFVEKTLNDGIKEIKPERKEKLFRILKECFARYYMQKTLEEAYENIFKGKYLTHEFLIKTLIEFLRGKKADFTHGGCEFKNYLNSLEFKIVSYVDGKLKKKLFKEHENLHKLADIFIFFYNKKDYKHACVILEDFIKTSFLLDSVLKEITEKWKMNKYAVFTEYVVKEAMNKNISLWIVSISGSGGGIVSREEVYGLLAERFCGKNVFAFSYSDTLFMIVENIDIQTYYKELETGLEIILNEIKNRFFLFNRPFIKVGFFELKKIKTDKRILEKIFCLIKNELNKTVSKKKIVYKNFSKEMVELTEKAKKRLEIEKEVMDSIKNGDFLIFYQEIKKFDSDEIYAVELLCRLKNLPDIDAEDFVNIIEEKSLTLEMDTVIFKKVLRNLETIKTLTDRFFINLFPTSLISEDFVSLIKKVADKAKRLGIETVIELTEHTIIENMNTLKKLDVKIAFDDFGSGYTNFERVGKISQINPNADILKIDGEIVKNIEDRHYFNILKSVTYFAKESDFKIIYEYVEKKEIFEKLKKVRKDFDVKEAYIQGYLFSKPKLLK